MPQPFELTVAEASAEIRTGRLSPTYLIESILDRVESVESMLHAWVRLDGDSVRAIAKQYSTEQAQGRLRGPLHGIPIGVKDIYFTAGLATEAGSALHAGFIPDHDADCVARLRQAGALILGKTETTQFAMADPAPTRNPWNLEHTPGGSSSGSAAAVAARMAPAALGTQTAGSVLRPAAYCGVVGFKPTYGRLSRGGIFPLAWTLDHPGILTRSVADAQLLLGVMDERPGVPADGLGAASPRFGLLRGPFLQRADSETLDSLEAAAATLAKAGATVREVALPERFDLSLDVHHLIMTAEAAAYHATAHHQSPESYRPLLRAAIEVGSLIPASAYLQAQRLRAELSQEMMSLFAGVDCLLMPSTPAPAPPGLATTGDPLFNAPWSLFGFPALALPSGLSRAGLPLSLQIIAPASADERLLQIAAWCERAIGPLPAPDVLPAVSTQAHDPLPTRDP